EHGDGLELLLQERADAAGHADPADHERDEPDEAQVHRELSEEATQHRLSVLVRAHSHGLVRERCSQLPLNSLRTQGLRQFQQMTVRHAASRLDKPARLKALPGNQYARAKAERPGCSIRFLLQNASDLELRVADL